MSVSEVFPCLDLAEVFDTLQRIPLAYEVLVDSKIYKDHLLIDDCGLFQRIPLKTIVKVFGIKDPEQVVEFLAEKRVLTDEKKERLIREPLALAEFLDYFIRAQQAITLLRQQTPDGVSSHPYLVMHKIQVPEYFRNKKEVPLSILAEYYAAVISDLQDSGKLLGQGNIGIVNQSYLAFAAIEERKSPGDVFITFTAARKYLPEKTIKDLVENQGIRTYEEGSSRKYNLADIQRVVLANRIADYRNMAAREAQADLSRDIPQSKLKTWTKRKTIGIEDLLKQPGMQHHASQDILRMIRRLKDLGITVEQEVNDRAFSWIEAVKEKKPTGDLIRTYLESISNCPILDAQSEKEIGLVHVEARESFMYSVVRNPHAALKIVQSIESLSDILESSLRSMFKEKIGKEKVLHLIHSVTAFERQACALEKQELTEERISKYRKLQDNLEQLFRDSKFTPWGLAKLAAKNLHERFFIPELDDRALAQKAYHVSIYAKHALARSIIRLGVSLARKAVRQYSSGDFTHALLDAVSEANIGIMKAVERWDPSRDVRFSTYATWWIRQRIVRYRSVGVQDAHTMKVLANQYRKALREYVEAHPGRKPSLHELGEKMNLTSQEVDYIRRWSKRPASIDQAIEEDEEETLSEILSKEEGTNGASHVDSIQLWSQVSALLNPEQYEVISQRFSGRTLEEISQELNVTRERVRQIEFLALKRLQKPKHARTFEGFISEEEKHGAAQVLSQVKANDSF